MTSCMYQINHILNNFQYIEVSKIIKKDDELENVYKRILRPKVFLEKLNADKNHYTLKKLTIDAFERIVKYKPDAERFTRKINIELDNLYKCFKLSFNELCEKDKCYACGDHVSKFCRVCNKYFCSKCIEEYHSPYERQKHFRKKDGKEINFDQINFIDFIGDRNFKEFLRSLVKDSKDVGSFKIRSEESYVTIHNELQAQNKIKCKCDTENNLNANFCIDCGISLKTDPRKIDDQKIETPYDRNDTKIARRACPACTFETDASKNFCEMCNQRL